MKESDNHSTKDDGSMELSSLHTVEGVTQTATSSPVQRPDAIEIEHLNSISFKEAQALLEKRRSLELEITAERASGAFSPGIYKVNGKQYWVVPKDWYNEDEIIGAMIYDLSLIVGADIRRTDTVKTEKTTLYDKKFVMGLWFGMFSTTNQKRSRSKQSYELGRTCVFSLIVKNAFISDSRLTEKALIKDHSFFGNNPGEVVNRNPSVFLVKTKLRSFFKDPKLGDLIFGILNQVSAQVGWSYLTDDEINKVISDHIIPVDQLITSFYPLDLAKNKKQKGIQKVRKPNAIRASPLYLSEEMELVSSMTSLIFGDMSSYIRDYMSTVRTLGFEGVSNRIQRIINSRFESLQRFASRTKLRLQAIRKITGSDKLRKASVVRDNVLALLNSDSDPAARLVSEIRHIIGNKDLISSISYAYKVRVSSEADAHAFLYNKALSLYQRVGITSMKTLTPSKMVREPFEINVENALKCVTRVNDRVGAISEQLKSLGSIKFSKLFGRFKQLRDLAKGVIFDIRNMATLEKISIEAALIAYYEDYGMTYEKFIDEISSAILSPAEAAEELLTLRSKIKVEGDEKLAIADFSQTLKVLISDVRTFKDIKVK